MLRRRLQQHVLPGYGFFIAATTGSEPKPELGDPAVSQLIGEMSGVCARLGDHWKVYNKADYAGLVLVAGDLGALVHAAHVDEAFVFDPRSGTIHTKAAGEWASELRLPDKAIDVDLVVEKFAEFVMGTHARLASGSSPETGIDSAAAIQIESVVSLWFLRSQQLGLSEDDQRVGDAVMRMLAEVLRVEEPSPALLRSGLTWLLRKADLFFESAAEAAGKAAGPITVGAAAYGFARATGSWEEFRTLARNALEALGR